MNSIRRKKRNRTNIGLFNPYENGISDYDLAFLSSKKISNSNTKNIDKISIHKRYFLA